MIELHWTLIAAFIAAFLIGDCGFWLWRDRIDRKAKRLLEEEVVSLERVARISHIHMVGTWGVIFALRDDASKGRWPSASAMTKHLDEIIRAYWKDPNAARDLMAREAEKLAALESTKKGEDE